MSATDHTTSNRGLTLVTRIAFWVTILALGAFITWGLCSGEEAYLDDHTQPAPTGTYEPHSGAAEVRGAALSDSDGSTQDGGHVVLYSPGFLAETDEDSVSDDSGFQNENLFMGPGYNNGGSYRPLPSHAEA